MLSQTQVTSKPSKTLSKVFCSVALTLAISPASVYAEPLKNFKAAFEVEAFGMSLGLAKQEMQCNQGLCTLTSKAKPSGFAAMLSSDSSVETIKLKQQQNQLNWLSYHKLGISEKNGKKKTKEQTLEQSPDSVKYIKNGQLQKQWPAKAKSFDSISLAYAIQHAKINNQSLDGFVLQDTKFQDVLTISQTQKLVKIPLAKTDKSVMAEKYQISSKNVKMDLWLLPNYQYFPGKIRIVNQQDKTITLSLAEPPKYYETQ